MFTSSINSIDTYNILKHVNKDFYVWDSYEIPSINIYTYIYIDQYVDNVPTPTLKNMTK